MTTEVAHPDTPERVDYIRPALEVFEDTHALSVSADLPGVAPGNVDVSLEDGHLLIVGRINGGSANSGRAYRRRIALSDPSRFDTDHISAALRHGVLELRIPKAEKAKPRQIPVTIN